MLFSSFSFCVIRVVLSVYLGLLLFLPAILIRACASSSLAFYMMYSAYRLNKQGDNIQLWCTPFPIWKVCCSMSVSKCCFLIGIQISQETDQEVWYIHLLKNFPVFEIYTVKGSGVINKAEVYVFIEFSCFSYDPVDVGNVMSGSSAFSKSSVNIWKFMVHVLLKPDLENFEHYIAGMWDDWPRLACVCPVVSSRGMGQWWHAAVSGALSEAVRVGDLLK